MSSLLVVPVSLLLVQMFRKIGPRPVTKEDRLKREEMKMIEDSENKGEFEEFDFEEEPHNEQNNGQSKGYVIRPDK